MVDEMSIKLALTLNTKDLALDQRLLHKGENIDIHHENVSQSKQNKGKRLSTRFDFVGNEIVSSYFLIILINNSRNERKRTCMLLKYFYFFPSFV